MKTIRFIPVTATKSDIARIYGRLAPLYDVWSVLAESRAATRAIELANVRSGERVLEVAVGTGRVFKKIALQNPDGVSYGVDLSPQMLARARGRMSPATSDWSLQVADAYHLPFRDGAFDLVVNNYMFDLLPEEDFAAVLTEFQRVLHPTGRVVIVAMTSGRGWYSRFWEPLLRRRPGLLACCRPVSLETGLCEAGFHGVDVRYVSQLTFPSEVVYGEKRA